MASYDSRLLTPPREEEEVYPYRRVWPSIAIESGTVFAVALGLFVLGVLLRIEPPRSLYLPLGVALALLPVGLWSIFSLWRERFALEPRERLLSVCLISALAANAVGIPVVTSVFQTERWLPLAGAVNRILGYTFTVGITQEMIKFLVVRYTVWPDCLRSRVDAVAYGAASAVGYATVLNLHFVVSDTALPDAVAGYVFATFALQLAASAVVSFGLAELRFGQPTPLLLPSTVGLAAFLYGVELPVRAGLVNAGLSLFGATAKPLPGLLFSTALLAGVLLMVAFLFGGAERKAREVAP